MQPIFFYNSQFIEWLDNEYESEYYKAYDNLKNISERYTEDDFFDKIEWCATTKMYRSALIELNHHKEKIKKHCGFGHCKLLPACLIGLE